MASEFTKPVFEVGGRGLEFRFEDDAVCIYGTPSGLRQLIEQIEGLVKSPGQQHIHLDNPILAGCYKRI